MGLAVPSLQEHVGSLSRRRQGSHDQAQKPILRCPPGFSLAKESVCWYGGLRMDAARAQAVDAGQTFSWKSEPGTAPHTPRNVLLHPSAACDTARVWATRIPAIAAVGSRVCALSEEGHHRDTNCRRAPKGAGSTAASPVALLHVTVVQSWMGRLQ